MWSDQHNVLDKCLHVVKVVANRCLQTMLITQCWHAHTGSQIKVVKERHETRGKCALHFNPVSGNASTTITTSTAKKTEQK